MSNQMRAIRIKTEHLYNPLGIDITHPRIEWNCEGGSRQTAYEITARTDGKIVWETGKVSSGEMSVRYGAKLHSRQCVELTITLYDENGIGKEPATAWFEMGFLEKECWQAKWINVEEQNLTQVNTRPVSYARRRFNVDGTGQGRLYITAHGIYVAYLNGRRVGDAVLAPGTSEYTKRLEYQTLDVTEYLQEGENELLVCLGDGWYRGKSGMNNTGGNLFGDDLSLLAQLEVDGRVVCLTDENWEASNEGAIRANGLDFGERVDATVGDGRFPTEGYHKIRTEDFGYDTLVCSNNVPIRAHESFQGKLFITPAGEKVIDFGQNMAGYVSFETDAKAGQKIRLVHGETLDEKGNFTIANFQHESMASEKMIYQEIDYVCHEGHNIYCPQFAIFGFQYMLVESDIPVEQIHFTAHAVYSDMEQTGFFTCGNADVNQLVSNSIWSMKGNFADIPTDCPTRERQGWTGDAGAFVETGVYLMDCYPVLRKWLNEVRLEQLPNGKVPGVAPKNEVPGAFKKMSDGSAGWADAIGIVPNALAKTYNCTDILEENYDALKRWVDFSAKRAKKSRLKAKFKWDKNKKYIVDTGFHWGEWLEPGVDTKTVLTETIMKGAPEVPTAYFAYSAESLAEDARLLGRTEDAGKYQSLSEKIKTAYRAKFLPEGRITSDRQAAYVRPIALDVITEEEKKTAAQTLNEMVIANGYHLNTGFLSTPYLCHVLTEYGYTDTAYRLLLQDTAPGWLYAVKKGATTIWETWDGKQEDGTVHDSLNHYSYGAITGWLFWDVAGIRLNFGRIEIAPHPSEKIGHAEATYLSPLGEIRSNWYYRDHKICYDITIPDNCTATIRLPGCKAEECRGTIHREVLDGAESTT